MGLGEHPGKSQLRDLEILFTGTVWQCRGQMCVGFDSSLGMTHNLCALPGVSVCADHRGSHSAFRDRHV